MNHMSNTNELTAATLTDEQIRTVMRDARENEDSDTYYDCKLALSPAGTTEDTGGGIIVTRDEARKMVADLINYNAKRAVEHALADAAEAAERAALDERIRTLREESLAVNDYCMVSIAELALGWERDTFALGWESDTFALSSSQTIRLNAMTVDEAREECVRVLDDVTAQAES